MRKLFLFLFLSLFTDNRLFTYDFDAEKKFFEFKNESNLNIFLAEVDKITSDLFLIMESFHGTETQLLNLLNTTSNLTTQILKNSSYAFNSSKEKDDEQKNNEQIYSTFSQLVCDFLNVLDLNKIEVSTLGSNLEKLANLQKSKSKETKVVYLKNLADKKEIDQIKVLIQEFSIGFSSYLNNELKIFVNDAHGRLCLYLECCSQDDLIEPLIFRKGGKKRKFFATLFGAIGNACVALVNLLSNKDKKDQKETILNLCGTALNLISDLNVIKDVELNGAKLEKKALTKVEQESLMNMTVQTIEDLYAILKRTNISLDVDKESKKFLLDKLDSFDNFSDRRMWIEKTLKTRGLSEKLLTAVFKCLRKCLQEVVEKVVDIISDRLLDIMVQYVNKKT